MAILKISESAVFQKIQSDQHSKKDKLEILNKYFLRCTSHPVPRKAFATYHFTDKLNQTTPTSARKKKISVLSWSSDSKKFYLNPTLRIKKNHLSFFKDQNENTGNLKTYNLPPDLRKILIQFTEKFKNTPITANQVYSFFKVTPKKIRPQEKALMDFILTTGILIPAAKTFKNHHVKWGDSFHSSLSQKISDLQLIPENSPEIPIKELLDTDLKNIQDTLEKLVLMGMTTQLHSQETFKNEFYAKYEFGLISFHEFVSFWRHHSDSLTKNLMFPSAIRKMRSSLIELFLLQNQSEIDIQNILPQKSDLFSELFKDNTISTAHHWQQWFGSLQIELFKNQWRLSQLFGAGLARAFSRYTKYDPNSLKTAKRLADYEESNSSLKIYEIRADYLSEEEQLITASPAFYKRRLVLNAEKKGKEDLSLDQIHVAYNGSYFQIYDQQKRPIQLRLNHLLNMNRQSNPYLKALHFLCVQSDFDAIDNFFLFNTHYTPQIASGKLIIIPKSLHFNESIFEKESIASAQDLKDHILKYPFQRWVFFVSEDRRLLIDLHSPTLTDFLYHLFKKTDSFQIRDAGLSEEEMKISKKFSDYLIPISMNFKDMPSPLITFYPEKYYVKRQPPAQLYNYFKIHCELPEMDEVLKRIGAFANKNKMTFFYIRYADPIPQIRFRARVNSKKPQIDQICHFLNSLIKEELIAEYEIKPYVRETERYGGAEGVELFEQISQYESQLVSKYLQQKHKSGSVFQNIPKHILATVLCRIYFSTYRDLPFKSKEVYSYLHNINPKMIKTGWSKNKKENLALLDHFYEKFLVSTEGKEFFSQTKKFAHRLKNLTKKNIITTSRTDYFYILLHMFLNRFELAYSLEFETDVLKLLCSWHEFRNSTLSEK